MKNQEKIKVLGIETSCDDTGIAVLSSNKGTVAIEHVQILSNLISSQVSIHKRWGGVVPNLARREHQRNIILLLRKALRESQSLKSQWRWRLDLHEKLTIQEILIREKYLAHKLKYFLKKWKRPDIDLIAVTIGPGLEPALWVGANFALALSKIWKIPLIGVDHLEAHIVANWLNEEKLPESWPNIALIVSGGHTELVLMRELNSYEIIGQTRDDAAGECFDKAARVLGLGYPGGPAISKLAEEWRNIDRSKVPQEILKIILPRPMLHSPDYDFSFSGLKTAIIHQHRNQSPDIIKSLYYKQKMAAEIEDAINDVLISKTVKAAKEYYAHHIFVGGGVSANKSLRQRFEQKAIERGLKISIPPLQLCTDNAVVIALAGLIHSKKATLSDTIKVNANLNLDNG